MTKLLSFVLIFFCQISFASEEIFDSNLEAKTLSNIRQVTFPSLGFEKAGEAYFSPDGNTIIFQAVPTGQQLYQIFTLDLKKGIPHMVSTGRGACTCAFFRPDGKKIIFASSHDDPEPNRVKAVPGYKREGKDYSWAFTPYMNIYESNPDGSELKALTTGEAYHAECAYSPDGTSIVFASNLDGSMNVFTMNADGSNITQVTHTKDCYNGGTFFSPNGKQIIFRADREKRHYLQIYMIDADGLNERQLTSNKEVNWAPYWHPNGKVIVYTTSKHGHMHYEIYGLNIETKAECRITHNAAFDGLPVFSPDGTKLMWTSKRGQDNTSQIFLADFTMPQELQ